MEKLLASLSKWGFEDDAGKHIWAMKRVFPKGNVTVWLPRSGVKTEFVELKFDTRGNTFQFAEKPWVVENFLGQILAELEAESRTRPYC